VVTGGRSKHIRYGTSSRATLDVYTAGRDGTRPVVVFVYGGGWSSGSRWMYTLVGDRLAQLGYVAVIVDYTLFPEGDVEHMLSDVGEAVLWTQREIGYGGERNVIALGMMMALGQPD